MLQNIYTFIEKAEKSGKYPKNTAYARKSALKVFESELNNGKSIHEAYLALKKKLPLQEDTLSLYKTRVEKLMVDYNKYGQEGQNLSSWDRKGRNRKKPPTIKNSNVQRDSFEITLTNGIAHISLPINISTQDSAKIIRLIKSLESESNQDE